MRAECKRDSSLTGAQRILYLQSGGHEHMIESKKMQSAPALNGAIAPRSVESCKYKLVVWT